MTQYFQLNTGEKNIHTNRKQFHKPITISEKSTERQRNTT